MVDADFFFAIGIDTEGEDVAIVDFGIEITDELFEFGTGFVFLGVIEDVLKRGVLVDFDEDASFLVLEEGDVIGGFVEAILKGVADLDVVMEQRGDHD